MNSRKRRIFLSLSLGLALGVLVALLAQSPGARAERSPFIEPPAMDPHHPTPVIVELFTSEGCSSCPAADQVLAELAASQPVEGAAIIPLGLHVDYWNDLGWTDRFSDGDFTSRQRAYARAFNSNRIYTPQMIVNGRREFVGSDRREALDAIREAAGNSALPVVLTVEPGNDPAAREVRLRIEGLASLHPREKGDVVLAVTENDLVSEVSRGENTGRTLRHDGVVRSLTRVGAVRAGDDPVELTATVTLEPDWNPDALRVVAFIQLHDGHAIVGATQVPLNTAS